MNELPIEVTLCAGLAPRQWWEQVLTVPHGSTAQEALARSEFAQVAAGIGPGADLEFWSPSVWSRAVDWNCVLTANDRLELSRGLRVDPMTARRERFSRQGTGRAGLFAKRRPGAKSGY